MEIHETSFDSPLGRQAVALRMAVFVDEQRVPADMEVDEHDPYAVHFVAVEAEKVVGTLRIVELEKAQGPAAKIGRVAVAAPLRGRGIGRQLMEAAIRHAAARRCATCILGAQVPVIGFYEKLGFVAHGPVFDDCGIPHRTMTLKVRAP